MGSNTESSTASWLCLVSMAKDENKIKQVADSADSDISLKYILHWQTGKAYNYHSGSYGLAFILK